MNEERQGVVNTTSSSVEQTMWRQCVLTLVLLLVGWAHSWDVAIGHTNVLEFYENGIKINSIATDHNHNIAALAYDEVHNMVLFVDKRPGNDAICAFYLSSVENKCLVERNGKNIRGIAFDPATEIVFFSDTYGKNINWFSLKPGFDNNIYGNLLLHIEHGTPTDIAVDSCRGYVYWINVNQPTPTIQRVRFNGSGREVVINLKKVLVYSSYLLDPHSLTIDQQTQRMYWIEVDDQIEYIRYADLNGQNEADYSRSRHEWNIPRAVSSIMTVSKTSLFALFQIETRAMLHKMTKNTYTKAKTTEFTFKKDETFGIVANYKIKERIQDLTDCYALTNIEERKFEVVPFCVHGEKMIEQSRCICKPGYIGERCDVSVCTNYCFRGSCTINYQGLPTCSCEEGYSGDRCQFDACYHFCLNGGKCSMNEAKETSCVCSSGYEGERCEYERSN